jgi:hypothetical protein
MVKRYKDTNKIEKSFGNNGRRLPFAVGIVDNIQKQSLFSTLSRPVLGPTQAPIQWVPWALSSGVKWLGHEADHSPPTSAEVSNTWIYIHMPSWRSA